MAKLPVDTPIRRVIKALGLLGFQTVREGNHIAMVTILNQTGISRDDFLRAYK